MDNCSSCGKSEDQVKELMKHREGLVCDECVGKVLDVLQDLERNGKKYDVPTHD